MKSGTPLLLIAMLLTLNSQAQPLPDPDQWLVADQVLPSVMLLGTFHFAYYNLDAHKVSERDQLDILSEARQAEMAQLLEHLLRFKPNKVAIEAGRNTGYLMQRYRDYLKGNYVLGRDEREKLRSAYWRPCTWIHCTVLMTLRWSVPGTTAQIRFA